MEGVKNTYHTTIDGDGSERQTVASKQVCVVPSSETRQSSQYESLKESSNDYLTPYSNLQPTLRTQSVANNDPDEYAIIVDYSSETR